MSTPDPALEPTTEDEHRVLDLQRLLDATGLWGEPRDGRRCDACAHYLNPHLPLAYCWHPDVRLLVGAAWSCDRFTRDPGS